MRRIYMAVTDKRGQLTIDGSLELFGSVLELFDRKQPTPESVPHLGQPPINADADVKTKGGDALDLD